MAVPSGHPSVPSYSPQRWFRPMNDPTSTDQALPVARRDSLPGGCHVLTRPRHYVTLLDISVRTGPTTSRLIVAYRYSILRAKNLNA